MSFTHFSKLMVGAIALASVWAFFGGTGVPVNGARAQNAFVLAPGGSSGGADTQPAATQFDRVLAVQRMLKANGFAVGVINGSLTSDTVAAIRSFQRQNSMRIDGQISESLITFLALHAVDKMETGDRADLAEAGSGDEGSLDLASRSVRAFVQRVLARSGFNPGRIDGVFVAETEQAIRDYQIRVIEAEEITGIVDTDLLSSLGSALE